MAQKIYFNWEDDDSTKDLNHRTLGISEPGRYRGFDFGSTSGLNLTLNHNTTGVNVTMFNTPTQSVEKRGVILTKQGVVIHETDDIVLPIAAGHATLPRIDVVICEHEYVEVQGGSTATYYVVQGTPATNPVAPTLTQPQIKTILGQILVPAGATNLNNAVYTQADAPQHANDTTIVRTVGSQKVIGEKEFSTITNEHDIAELDNSSQTIDFFGKRKNLYVVESVNPATDYQIVNTLTNLPSNNDGTFAFELLFKQRTILKNSVFQPNGNMEFQNVSSRDLYVEEGEIIKVIDTTLTGINFKKYLVCKNDASNASDYVKHRKMVSMTKMIIPFASAVSVPMHLETLKKANVIEFSPMTNFGLSTIINSIEGNDTFDTVRGEQDAGTIVYLRVSKPDSVSNDCEMTIVNKYTNLADPIPAGYKKIVTNTGGNIAVKNNTTITLLEHEDYYEVINVSGPEVNLYNLSLNVVKPWHNVGGGTLMENFQPAPNIILANAIGFYPQRLRDLGHSKVEIGGVATKAISVKDTIENIFTLPSGYRPSKACRFSINAMVDNGSSETSYALNLDVSPSGLISIYIPSSAPSGTYYFPFDGIIIPLD